MLKAAWTQVNDGTEGSRVIGASISGGVAADWLTDWVEAESLLTLTSQAQLEEAAAPRRSSSEGLLR